MKGVAYRKGWIDEDKMRQLAQPMLKNQYGQYLISVIDEIKRTGNPNIQNEKRVLEGTTLIVYVRKIG